MWETVKKYNTLCVLTAGIVFVVFLTGAMKGYNTQENENQKKNVYFLCLDDSGSMYSKQKERNENVKKFLEQLPDKDMAGGLYFQYDIEKKLDPIPLNGENSRKRIDDFFGYKTKDNSGNTNMGKALETALATLGNEVGSNRQPVVILFTDGKNDYIDDDGDRLESKVKKANEQLKDALKTAELTNIPVHVICLGEDVDLSVFEESKMTSITTIGDISTLEPVLCSIGEQYKEKSILLKNINIGGAAMVVMLLVIAACAGAGGYAYYKYKKKELVTDYVVERIHDDLEERVQQEALARERRKEQENKKFYVDVTLFHGNAVGARSCFQNNGERRGGIFSIGDIEMLGRNQRGEDYTYHIDEAGLEIWATLEEDEVILRTKKEPFEIRLAQMARDEGQRTQKATLKSGKNYYIILNSKHEILLMITKGL